MNWFTVIKTKRCDVCDSDDFTEDVDDREYTHWCNDCGYQSEHHKRPLTSSQQKYLDRQQGASRTPSKKQRNRAKREARRAKRRGKK